MDHRRWSWIYGFGAGALVMMCVMWAVLVEGKEPDDHYPKYTERLEQCEALLGKSINLTTQCVNQREAEKCKEKP